MAKEISFDYLNVMEKNNGSYVLYGSTSGVSLYLLDNTRSYSPRRRSGSIRDTRPSADIFP